MYNCYTEHGQKNPAVSFENEAEAKKWCDGYNNAPVDYNSLWGSFRYGTHAFYEERKVNQPN